LGIPAGTVKSRSYYALRLLSRNLPGPKVSRTPDDSRGKAGSGR
ncbi:sigma-70 family RNA polymerase sigma factor, partial [Streptomyces sp. NPDC005093]